MKKTIIIFLTAVMVLTTMAACSGKGKLVGTWASKAEDSKIIFEKNGTGELGDYDFKPGRGQAFTYKVKGKKVTLSSPEMSGVNMEMNFKVSGNKLTLTFMGESVTFTKQ